MVSDGEFVSKTSKGKELDGKKAPGRTGAERTGKMSHRACYFEGWWDRGLGGSCKCSKCTKPLVISLMANFVAWIALGLSGYCAG